MEPGAKTVPGRNTSAAGLSLVASSGRSRPTEYPLKAAVADGYRMVEQEFQVRDAMVLRLKLERERERRRP